MAFLVPVISADIPISNGGDGEEASLAFVDGALQQFLASYCCHIILVSSTRTAPARSSYM